jgi:uncharacterized protein (UPF0333 family)
MRAQISMEFLVVFSIMIVLFMMLFSVAGDLSRDMDLKKEKLAAMDVVDSLALYINLVHQAGNGASLNVSLASTIGGASYNLSAMNRSVLVFWKDSVYSSPILASSVNLSVSNYTDFFIRNINGVVVLESQ